MIDKAFALLVALVLGVFSAPCTTEAQGVAKVRKVGELHPGTGSAERLAALREAGYLEGQNLVVVRRHAEGRIERLPALAAELVGLRPDVILATGSDAIRAAKNATKIIPVVMAFGDDPVGKGLVTSLARPGGNITGVSLVATGTMAAKRIEVFKEAMPRAPYRAPKLAHDGDGASEGS
jgi:putative ABC transport system substrate-binding protein